MPRFLPFPGNMGGLWARVEIFTGNTSSVITVTENMKARWLYSKRELTSVYNHITFVNNDTWGVKYMSVG